VVKTVEGVRNAEDGTALDLEIQRIEHHRLMSRRGKATPRKVLRTARYGAGKGAVLCRGVKLTRG